jgi:hypothetical protein
VRNGSVEAMSRYLHRNIRQAEADVSLTSGSLARYGFCD